MRRLFYAVMSFLLPSVALTARPSTDPDQAISLLEGAVQAIRSFDVRVEIRLRFLIQSELVKDRYIDENNRVHFPVFKSRRLRPNEAPAMRHHYFRQVYENGKGRIEILEPSGTANEVRTDDGEIAVASDVGRSEAVIRKPSLNALLPGMDYRETYRSVMGSLSLLKCLRDRKPHDCVSVIEPTADSPFLTLQAKPLPEPWTQDTSLHGWGFRARLDPRRGMLPAVIELDQPVQGKSFLYRRTTVNEWRQLAGGVWVPVKATSHIYFLDPSQELHGEVGNEIELVVDVARSSWNVAVPEGAFRLPLPAGTKVTDMERGVRFVTGQADPGKHLADLAAHARQVAPVQMGLPVQESGWSWLVWGLLSGGVVLVIVALHFYRKHRFKHA